MCLVSNLYRTHHMKTSDQQSRMYTLFVSNNLFVNFLSGISTVALEWKEISLISWITHIYNYFPNYFLFIFECLPRIATSIVMNCYQWGSYFPCKTLIKEPIAMLYSKGFGVHYLDESVMIDNFKCKYRNEVLSFLICSWAILYEISSD